MKFFSAVLFFIAALLVALPMALFIVLLWSF